MIKKNLSQKVNRETSSPHVKMLLRTIITVNTEVVQTGIVSHWINLEHLNIHKGMMAVWSKPKLILNVSWRVLKYHSICFEYDSILYPK